MKNETFSVCLDAGHYGKYNRSPAVPEYYESDMAWKLHNYLAEELESYCIQAKKTRANQATDLGLTARGKASAGCDLFLSLHSNAVGSVVSESVDYVRVYHLYEDAGTDVDDKSKELAQILAPIIAETMGVKQGGQIASRKASKDSNGDGVLNDNYYGVLNGARLVGTPGLILEHSFHTNTRATQWLLDDTNLKKLAQVEAAAIAAWFGVDKPESPSEPTTAAKYYRVRKSWEDATSQRGAYLKLENAKANCPDGYTVFDWNGQAVYPFQPYLVRIVADKLNVRAGAGVNYKITTTVKKGQAFTIVEENGTWGKLKSGAGWISLKPQYSTKV